MECLVGREYFDVSHPIAHNPFTSQTSVVQYRLCERAPVVPSARQTLLESQCCSLPAE